VQPQRFEQLCEGLQATGGGADSDDRKCTSPLLAGLFRDLVVLQLRFGGLLGALSRMARSSVGQAITSSRSFAHGLVPAIRAPRRAQAACACRPGRQATMGDPLLDELLGPPRWAATNPRFYTLVRLRAARLKGLESPTVDEARPAIPGKPRNTLSPESGTTRADDAVRWTLLYASMSPTRSLRRLAPEQDEQGVWPSTSSPVNSSTRASFWTSRPPRRGPRGRAAPGGPLAQQGHRGPAGAPLASIDNPGSMDLARSSRGRRFPTGVTGSWWPSRPSTASCTPALPRPARRGQPPVVPHRGGAPSDADDPSRRGVRAE